jgi:hypothetical protein
MAKGRRRAAGSLAELKESEIIAFVFVILHRLTEDIVGRQSA